MGWKSTIGLDQQPISKMMRVMDFKVGFQEVKRNRLHVREIHTLYTQIHLEEVEISLPQWVLSKIQQTLASPLETHKNQPFPELPCAI